MAGVSLLLVFMDHQAGRELKNRLGDLPSHAESAVDSVEREGRPALDRLRRLDAPSIPAPAVPSTAPVRRRAQEIFRSVSESKPGPDRASVRVNGGWDLYYIVYKGGDSELVRVRRKWPGPAVTLKSVLQYLQKGPTAQEHGLLNPFDDRTRIIGVWLEGTELVMEVDRGLLRMSEHVIQDRVDQIVFTLTQFAEVKSVRLIVDGAEKPFLNTPLKRSSRRVRDFP
jgi:hypothetical protein